MVEKLKKGEKSKRLESEPNHPAQKGKLAKETRGKMKGLASLEKFEKSEIGHEIMAVFGSVSEILESEGSIYPVFEMLATVSDGAGREAALVFLKAAAKKFPELIRDGIQDPGFDRELRERLIGEMGWDEAELPISAVVPAKPRPLSEKGEMSDYPALVAELVETPAYRAVLDGIDADEIVDSLKRSNPAIDWDGVVLKMEVFSVESIMAYLGEKKIKFTRPKPNSIESIVSDPNKLEKAFDKLGNIYGDVDPRHFGAFALMVADKNPKFVFDYYTKNTFAQVRDPDSKKALVKLLVEKGYPAKESLFEEPPAE